MTVNTQKLVRVLAAPTGPTGTMRGVNILPTFTGPTGVLPRWGQINAAAQASGPTGTFEEVYWKNFQAATGYTGATGNTGAAPVAGFKTVIISGFTGPA